MKLIKLLIVLSFLSLVTQSCQSDPGEYSSMSASKYNYAPYSAEEAWSQAMQLFDDKLVADDSAKLSLEVKYFETVVKINFEPLTARSSKYKVSSRRYLVVGAQDSVNTVYSELERHFNQ
ncbi:hypothetical protein PQO03_19055 [Lentisphaera profundi]|uniref:DUF3568 family protein n=1 Tax=Lentisphaera profundi TaxID=1658616 RepID=A0ABY7VXC7_9BACT|nr:hypothetical protein [Lentisphaera profundi]WDE97928.1 hypothetical protein PQO03_19055 [Lentisphaera profundi]